MRQLVRSVSGDNLLFYVCTTPCLWLQQEAEWGSINFERKDLNFPQKSHPPSDDFKEICFFLCFSFKKTKCNRFFFHIFNTKLMWYAFELLLPDTVSSSTSYQQWHIRQWLLINPPWFCLIPFLIFSPIKQPYSKVGNSGMYRYGNAVFILN